jgi:hypothetical protein
MSSKKGPKFQISWTRTSIPGLIPATKAAESLVRLLLTVCGTDGCVYLANDAVEISCIASLFAAQGSADLETTGNLWHSS